MLSRRLPADSEPNAWARRLEARRRAQARLFDLTETNPTRVGLAGADAAALAALAAPEGVRYEPAPRGLDSARAALAAYYAARGTPVAPEHLVLTASTSEAYAHLFRLLADPGETVLVPAPSYPLFEPLARLEGVTLSTYRLAYDGAWHLDRASLERAASAALAARALVVVQPNHPTGSCLSGEDMDFVEATCAAHGLALISDEVFGDFGWSTADPADARPAAPAVLPGCTGRQRVPTFVLGGLSKMCGMPQIKLAWIAVAGPGRDRALEGLEWIADLFLSVSTPAQLALPRLLEARPGFQARVHERLAVNLERLAALSRARPEVMRLSAQGGWVAILRLPARRSGEAWALDLLDRDVVVHPGHFYDLQGEAMLVLSLIPDPADFAEGAARFETLLAGR